MLAHFFFVCVFEVEAGSPNHSLIRIISYWLATFPLMPLESTAERYGEHSELDQYENGLHGSTSHPDNHRDANRAGGVGESP